MNQKGFLTTVIREEITVLKEEIPVFDQ